MRRCSAKTKVSSVRIYRCEKAAGCQTTSCDLIQLHPALRTSAITQDQRWHACREGLPMTWITTALSVKVRSWCKQSMSVIMLCIQSEFGGLLLPRPWPWAWALFWSVLANLLKISNLILRQICKSSLKNYQNWMQLWSWYRFGFHNEQVKSKYEEKQHIFGDRHGL